MYKKLLILILAGTTLLAGCGGDGSSTTVASTVQGTDNKWVRDHLDDVYLWNNEIVDVPPQNYASAPDYFDALLVKSRDRFSFSMPLADAVSHLQEGVETGFGVKWGWAAPGRLFAFYVDPNSPAAASVTRGMEVTSVNGQPVANLATSYLNGALFPGQAGASVNLTLRSPGTAITQSKDLTSATFSTTTVSPPSILTLPGGVKAGYLLFNQHLFSSEPALTLALTYFKQQNVSELVLDLRYNTGGFLLIAEEVASMIGGAAVQGKVFEKLSFNSKHPEKTQNPNYTILFNELDSNGDLLPLLGLDRVFVLTGSSTCSASEAIINGLTPFIQVVRIGWTTCGKPYGFIQNDNEGQAYFAIQFEGVNANGLDDYKTGFAPTCQVSDDLNYPLGDGSEGRLSAALYFMNNNACPPASAGTLPKAVGSSNIPDSGDVQMLDLKPGLKLLR